jgi:uncharacterized protein (TIGR02646 family)
VKQLPDGRDKDAEEQAYLAVCHRTKRNCPGVKDILNGENFFDATKRPDVDVWAGMYDRTWYGPVFGKHGTPGSVSGDTILSALRDHLAGLQGKRCCYCFQVLQTSGHARHIDHVLPKSTYRRFSFHFWNLVVACERCNRIKKDVGHQPIATDVTEYPESTAFTHQFHPRFHPYKKHIDFVSAGTPDYQFFAFSGLTDQGKQLYADILKEACEEMNRESSDPTMKAALAKMQSSIPAQDDAAMKAVQAFQGAIRNHVLAA